MGKYFNKLPKPWQEAINFVIADTFGDDPAYAQVVEAWRESEAEVELQSELDPEPSEEDRKDYQAHLIWFKSGWAEALKRVPRGRGVKAEKEGGRKGR